MTTGWPERWRRAALATCLALAAGPAAPASAADCAPLPRGVDFALGAHADAHGLLWRVTAADGRASVLLGTMHVADARLQPLARAVLPVFAASRHYALEVALDGAAMAALQAAMFFDDGRRLPELLGADLFARAAGYLALRGVPAAAAELMKPWAALVVLSQPPAAAGVPLEFDLFARAGRSGMPVSGLETVAEQVALFEQRPPAETLALLREAVCHNAVMAADFERMIGAYVARDLAALTRHALKYFDAARLPLLEDLVWSRNRRMVERMLPLLAAGDSFIAIGALHLPGDRGVLRLLEQRGYAVEAIY